MSVSNSSVMFSLILLAILFGENQGPVSETAGIYPAVLKKNTGIFFKISRQNPAGIPQQATPKISKEVPSVM